MVWLPLDTTDTELSIVIGGTVIGWLCSRNLGVSETVRESHGPLNLAWLNEASQDRPDLEAV